VIEKREVDVEIKNLIFAAGFLLSTAGLVGASAGELVYQPINPSFGGNPFNSSHLLGLAEAQNQHIDEPRFSAGTTGLSQADLFVRQLQSRLLSGLAAQVSDAIFGENAQDSGEVVFGDHTITFQRGLEFIDITIFDGVSGGTTEIRVPVLQIADPDGASLSGLGP
jgi:curli production assembly/transport component CsgF